eukprot:jgi/Ulvmu1/4444/UM002_0169.1
MVDCAKGIRIGASQLMDPHSKTARRDIDRNATSLQLQVLYDVKLFIDLSDEHRSSQLKAAARVLEKTCKRIVMIKRITALLEKESHYHPAVLAMEHQLQNHGLDHMLQALLDDDHDPWTLCQCSAGDLVSKYHIPMGTAVRLLHSMRDSTQTDTGKGSWVQRKSSNRIIAHHVATAILTMIEMAHKKQSATTTYLVKASSLQQEKIQKMQRWAWRLIGSQRWQTDPLQLPEIRIRQAQVTAMPSRDTRNYHLPSWLPSLRAGGSRVHIQPQRDHDDGHADGSMYSSQTRAALDMSHLRGTYFSVAGKNAQTHYMESSGSDVDDDQGVKAC